jgi:hypothetical protein
VQAKARNSPSITSIEETITEAIFQKTRQEQIDGEEMACMA